MLKTRFEWTILLVIATLLGSAWIVYSREPAAQASYATLTEAPMVGHLAPDFTLPTAVSTDTITLTTYIDRQGTAGQPVVLNFWATWCGPCRIEMPHLQAASQAYQGQVTFLGVNQAESVADITHFATEFDITYPLLVDQDNSVNNLYQVRSLPTTVFIGADGLVEAVIVGTINRAVLEDRIQQLLRTTE